MTKNNEHGNLSCTLVNLVVVLEMWDGGVVGRMEEWRMDGWMDGKVGVLE